MAIEELQNGRYRHLRLLGSGGMGEVYLMQDTRVNRQVAIKVLRAEVSLYPGDEKSSSSARLFEREARAIAALDHPNILPLYDFGEESAGEGLSMAYMVMPYCAEGSLETWLRPRGGELLPPRQVAALIEQAADGLQYAHEHKVIHLDVKPPNFLLRSNRKDPTLPTLLLADFGIARNFTTVSSSSRTIRGTPAAMSPEQWSGEPVFASDQYALAVMAYEMLVGRPPFVGSMEQLMYRHFSVAPPAPSSFNPRLSAGIDGVLQRALAKKPEERFPSIMDFALALSEATSQPGAYSEEDMAHYGTLEISPSEAEVGISRMVTLAGGEEVTVSVPAGAQDGQVLRLERADSAGEKTGSVLVNIAIQRAGQAAAISEDSIETFTGSEVETPPALAKSQEAAAPITPRLADSVQKASVTPAPAFSQLRLASLSAAASAPESAAIAGDGHDQPTIAGIGGEQGVTMAPRPLAQQPRRRLGLLAVVSVLVILAILGVSVFYIVSNHQATTAGTQPTPTHVVARVTPTTAPTATPTAAPGEYIAGTYNGSMATNSGNSTPLSVYLIQTQGSGALKGSATINSSQTYTLQGTVDLQGNFTLTVQPATGQLPLILFGAVQNSDFLHGSYCHSATSPCLSVEGYFTVGPRS